MDITLPENSAWYDKYKYDIPVFHLNGKFLMKHQVDIQKFEDQLMKLELQDDGNQWRKCSCFGVHLKGLCNINWVKKQYSLPCRMFLRMYSTRVLKNLSDSFFVCVLSSSPASLVAAFSVPFICCYPRLAFYWGNKCCYITANKVKCVCVGFVWQGFGSWGATAETSVRSC